MWPAGTPPWGQSWDHDDDPDSELCASGARAASYGGRQEWGGHLSSEYGQRCPHCNSHRVTPSHLGRRIGSTIGTIAGAATATARVAGGAQLGAEIGSLLGTPAGPAGLAFGTVAGAVLGAMAGAAAGCAVGAALGEAIDAKILHSHRCIDCGQRFSLGCA